jgi:uncharacterized protein
MTGPDPAPAPGSATAVDPPSRASPELRGFARTYWEAAARGELRLPRCVACTTFAWPPRPRCPACGSDRIDWVRTSGRGVVHTFTVVHQASDPDFRARVPYVVAMIDLDEGVRLLGNVVDCAVDDVGIGMPVAVACAPAGEGVAVPVFRPARVT